MLKIKHNIDSIFPKCPRSCPNRFVQSFEHGLRNFGCIRLCGLLRVRQVPQCLPLAVKGHCPIADKGCQNFFMTQILALGFELLRRLTQV